MSPPRRSDAELKRLKKRIEGHPSKGAETICRVRAWAAKNKSGRSFLASPVRQPIRRPARTLLILSL